MKCDDRVNKPIVYGLELMLERLDLVLDSAISQVPDIYGPQAVGNAFRGLRINLWVSTYVFELKRFY